MNITKEKAVEMLLSFIDKENLGDRFYEFAQEVFQKAIASVEKEHIIVDVDGIPYTEEDDEMWYDDTFKEFLEKLADKLAKELKNGFE